MVIHMLGQEIKKARIKLGMSQSQLAEKIGVSKVTICWYENGKRTPQLDKFTKLVKVLDISPDLLLGQDQTVSYVENNEEYITKVASRDIDIINAIKEYPNVYNQFYEDPERTAKLVSLKLK